MSNEETFPVIFDALKKILSPYASELDCVRNKSNDYYLDTKFIMKNKKPLFFGAVQIRKNYVSYHLMPIYVFPDLLEQTSHELRNRMQGKSCFNFRHTDADIFAELVVITKVGFNAYKKAGYV